MSGLTSADVPRRPEPLLSRAAVAAARAREAGHTPNDPIVAGLAVGRPGEETVLAFRIARDARSIAWTQWTDSDPDTLARAAAGRFEGLRGASLRLHTVFVGITNVVAGSVADRLRQAGYPVIEVDSAGPAGNVAGYRDKGSESWGELRTWITGGAIPDDPELARQLASRAFRIDPLSGHVATPSSEALNPAPMSTRAEALALTFALRIASAPRIATLSRACRYDYNPLEGM